MIRLSWLILPPGPAIGKLGPSSLGLPGVQVRRRHSPGSDPKLKQMRETADNEQDGSVFQPVMRMEFVELSLPPTLDHLR